MGVDLGLEAFAVLSDGTRREAPKPLAKALRLLKRRSRQLSRKQKGSKNRRKAALKLARLHRRIRHQVTTRLAKTKPALVVEGLSVRGLVRGPFSRSVSDSGLEYKAYWYGSKLIVSTRTCSVCGYVGPAGLCLLCMRAKLR